MEILVPRDRAFGTDTDGQVIFDLDADRVLANFDLLIPKCRWKVRDTLRRIGATRKADLVFSVDTIKHKRASLPLSVTTDAARRQVAIEFH